MLHRYCYCYATAIAKGKRLKYSADFIKNDNEFTWTKSSQTKMSSRPEVSKEQVESESV